MSKESERESRRKWRKKHPGYEKGRKVYKKEWYRKNLEKVAAYGKEYYQKNKERIKKRRRKGK